MDNSALSVKHMYSYLLHGKAADGSKSTVEAQDTVLKTVLGPTGHIINQGRKR
ncbi:hypothetical protein OS493_039100 [Desmophyllum pertusum]|uniref:Uncharacterized protein n=1 Tax=Desmophyllum pertusum TaxID=174260 RepID=A0A9X0D5M6_9CNID|nr:hypothetical protein OS493_039100 [Desmophyllum pertusum]